MAAVSFPPVQPVKDVTLLGQSDGAVEAHCLTCNGLTPSEPARPFVVFPARAAAGRTDVRATDDVSEFMGLVMAHQIVHALGGALAAIVPGVDPANLAARYVRTTTFPVPEPGAPAPAPAPPGLHPVTEPGPQRRPGARDLAENVVTLPVTRGDGAVWPPRGDGAV